MPAYDSATNSKVKARLIIRRDEMREKTALRMVFFARIEDNVRKITWIFAAVCISFCATARALGGKWGAPLPQAGAQIATREAREELQRSRLRFANL